MPSFGQASLTSRAQLLPPLQALFDAAIKETDFRILDAMRGRAAQEAAFKKGNSKVHFGDSAHNWKPAVAADLFPAPYDWNNKQSFLDLSVVILRIAKAQGTPIRWGGDFNMDGNKTTNDDWDPGHYELYPWRDWAKKYSHPFEG